MPNEKKYGERYCRIFYRYRQFLRMRREIFTRTAGVRRPISLPSSCLGLARGMQQGRRLGYASPVQVNSPPEVLVMRLIKRDLIGLGAICALVLAFALAWGGPSEAAGAAIVQTQAQPQPQPQPDQAQPQPQQQPGQAQAPA